jgi:hypothetical protein
MTFDVTTGEKIMKTILAYLLYHIGDTVWNIMDSGILPDRIYDIFWRVYQKTMGWSSDFDTKNEVWGPYLTKGVGWRSNK